MGRKTVGDRAVEIFVQINKLRDHHHNTMPVAQILDITVPIQEREHFLGLVVERGQKGLMNDWEVIGVGGVLKLDFPVAGKAETVLSTDRDGVTAALLHKQIDPGFRVSQKFVEGLGVVIEGRKYEARILFDAQGNQ